MKRQAQFIFIVLSIGGCVLTFQNCGGYQAAKYGDDTSLGSTGSTPLPNNTPPPSPTPMPTPTPTTTPTPTPTPVVVDPAIKALVNQSVDRSAQKIAATITYLNARGAVTQILPRSTLPAGGWRLVGPEEAGDWVAGFFPGVLWQIYQARGLNLADARKYTALLANVRAPKQNPPPLNYLHGNLGFDMTNSYINKLEMDSTASAADVATTKSILMRAAGDLNTNVYHPNIRAIIDRGTWAVSGTDAYVPVDYIMVVEPLFWAAKNGGSAAYATAAINHATTIMNQHIRADGGTFHHVIFSNAGAVLRKETHQGFSNTSTWARGQAWAVYGFTMVYRETSRPEFLAAATKVADYFISRLPADKVPPWDFDAPAGAKKDSSAAAIAASGLLELSQLTTDMALRAKYLTAAEQILVSLMSNYLSPANRSTQMGILLHGVGHMPYNSEVDVSLIYGDYYFLEALNRYKAIYTF